MEALLIKFTKEELSKLDNFKRRIENTLDDYPDIEDSDYNDLHNFRESFENIAKDILKLLDHITLSKIKKDIDNKENTEDGYTIISKYFSNPADANLYYLELCDKYDEVNWLKIPHNLSGGLYKYKVCNNYNNGCNNDCNNNCKCKQDIRQSE